MYEVKFSYKDNQLEIESSVLCATLGSAERLYNEMYTTRYFVGEFTGRRYKLITLSLNKIERIKLHVF